MKKTLVFAILLLSPLLLSAAEPANVRHITSAAQNTENSSIDVQKEPVNWDQVGASIKETSGKTWEATKHTSKKAWDATKRGSSKAWQATKETSSEAWDATKQGTAKAWNTTKHAVSDE